MTLLFHRPFQAYQVLYCYNEELAIFHNNHVYIEQQDIVHVGDVEDTSLQSIPTTQWYGFKLVGDNLDKDVKPRYVRVDQQTKSLHFFHYYAVRDRIDLSSFSNNPNPHLDLTVSDLPFETLLPSASDNQVISYNFGVLVSRVLVEELKYFHNTFEGAITHHIIHTHSTKMTRKSEVVN